MTISPRLPLIISTSGLVVLLFGLYFFIASYLLPKMSSARETIRRNEAAVTAIQRQQDNVSELTKQLADRQAEKERLDEELWRFSQEDTFFEIWDSFGTPTQTAVTLETIADATPGPVPVQREAQLTMEGTLTNITKTIQSLASLTPAVVLREVRLTPNPSSEGSTVAAVTVATLWYDDTLR